MIRATTILSLAFVLGISLAGCSKKDVTSESERLTIAVIPKGTIHEFWKTVHAVTEQPSCEMVRKCCISHTNLVKGISDEN